MYDDLRIGLSSLWIYVTSCYSAGTCSAKNYPSFDDQKLRAKSSCHGGGAGWNSGLRRRIADMHTTEIANVST